jgi:hypothetical protein
MEKETTMSSSLETLLGSAPSGRSRPLLLDHAAYGTAVIRQGQPVPWTDLAALTGYFGQVEGLLEPDATWVDVAGLYDAHLAGNAELTTAMAGRTRTGYALRTLLADEAGIDLVQRTASSLNLASRRPLVLAVPSPAQWLARTHRFAGYPLEMVDEDDADRASMYLAEWLGRLGSLPVALLLLDARPADEAARIDTKEALSGYTAITNVCDHFAWSVAVRRDDGIDGIDADPRIGLVAESFWLGGADLPDGAVMLASIPASASPERVLDQLALLR